MSKKIFEKVSEAASKIEKDSLRGKVSSLKGTLKDQMESVKDKGVESFETLKEKGVGHLETIKETGSEHLGKIAENDAVVALLEKAGNFKDKIPKYYDQTIGAILADNTIYHSFLGQLGKLHTHSENDAIQEAIDGLAHMEGYGGGVFHRIADGRHSITGAFKAVSEELPDSPYIEKVGGVLEHLWADFHTKVGIPIISFSSYDQFKSFCDSIHLPAGWVQDFLTVNSTEILGSALTIVPTIFRLNEMETADFAKVAGRVGMLTVGGESQFEILGSLFSLSMLGKAFFEATHAGEPVTSILKEATTEGGWTGASLVTIAILPFPFSIAGTILLVGLRSQIEQHGLEEVFTNSKERVEDLFEWIKEDGLTQISDVIG